MRRRAFTLIELLIVIAIIGLLATFAMIGLSRARASSRDTKRLADLAQIQKALALGQGSIAGGYPSTASVTLGLQASDVLCLNGANVQIQADPTGCVANNTYMNPIPADPRSGTAGYDYAYKYYPGPGANLPSYCIQTTLENGVPNLGLAAGTVMNDPTGTKNGTCP